MKEAYIANVQSTLFLILKLDFTDGLCYKNNHNG